jgi:hypothetical protein
VDEQRYTECAFWIAFWGQVSADKRLKRINAWVHREYMRLFERCLARGWPEWAQWPPVRRDQVLRSVVTFINGLTASAVVSRSDWPADKQVEQLRLQLQLLRAWAALPPARGPTSSESPARRPRPDPRRRSPPERPISQGSVMDFALTEEQQMIVKSTRDFVEQELYPHEQEIERTGELRPELLLELKAKAIDAGLYAANMPVEVGGAGLDAVTWVLYEKELGRTSYVLHYTCVARPSNILLACVGEQRERYLLPAVRGERSDCLAMIRARRGFGYARHEDHGGAAG